MTTAAPDLKVYHSVKNFGNVTNPIVTMGTFDGVHVGHRSLLDRINSIAEQEQGESVLLTFHPHPRLVLFPEQNDLRMLNSPTEQIERLEAAGLQHLIIQPFDLAFSRLSALEYVRSLIVEGIGAHKMVVGYDHRFGKNREGDFRLLREYAEMFGFQVEEIPAQMLLDVNVSSTKIRKALESGDLLSANQLLGYNYPLSGIVIEGDGIGKTMGYPTANLQLDDPLKLVPASGVYAVNARLGTRHFPAMMNIGTRPTISDSGELRIEVHLLEGGSKIYGESIEVELVARLRDERRFASKEELTRQLAFDRTAAIEALQ